MLWGRHIEHRKKNMNIFRRNLISHKSTKIVRLPVCVCVLSFDALWWRATEVTSALGSFVALIFAPVGFRCFWFYIAWCKSSRVCLKVFFVNLHNYLFQYINAKIARLCVLPRIRGRWGSWPQPAFVLFYLRTSQTVGNMTSVGLRTCNTRISCISSYRTLVCSCIWSVLSIRPLRPADEHLEVAQRNERWVDFLSVAHRIHAGVLQQAVDQSEESRGTVVLCCEILCNYVYILLAKDDAVSKVQLNGLPVSAILRKSSIVR